jgi:hypothetical protein
LNITGAKLRNCERVPEELNIRHKPGLKINTDNVIAKWRIIFDLTEEFTGYVGEIALLFRVNRGLSRHYVARGASLDFDETKSAAIPTHQIKLTAAARAAVIAGDDHVTLFTQIEVCSFLAEASGVKVLRGGVFARQKPSAGIESAKREAG